MTGPTDWIAEARKLGALVDTDAGGRCGFWHPQTRKWCGPYDSQREAARMAVKELQGVKSLT